MVNLNDEAVCKLCFPSTCEDKKFSEEFFQRSFETVVHMSHSLYKCILLIEAVCKIKKIFFGRAKKLVENSQKNFFGTAKSSDTGKFVYCVAGSASNWRQVASASQLRDIEWTTHSCTIGFPVCGRYYMSDCLSLKLRFE